MESVKEILTRMGAPTKEDLEWVEKVSNCAAEAQKDHKRFGGEPYLVHLVETAKGLAGLGMGAKTVAAGLLHDCIEDVNVKPETLEAEFGKEIRFLVEGVTKLGRLKYRGAERHRESLRKLLVATGKDARVLIIKLMDRLHNMRTLRHVPEEKRTRIALETLEIYAAIAHRLGMGQVRRQLEDLAFENAFPKEFAETKKLLAERSKETFERLEKMSRTLRKEVAKEGITGFHSDYRVKGLYSFWRKLERKGGDVGKGDDIASPKPNGYQSLHTTVFSGDGGIVEVQIRTEEMHAEAEYGITAAHVFYKEGESSNAPGARQSSFDWIKSLLPGFRRSAQKKESGEQKKEASKRARYGAQGGPDWLEDLTEESQGPDFETTLRADIFTERVFVFTPTGDVVDLPANSSSIDFAYAIHSDIGDHVAGAKVNGNLLPLDTPLHNGDIVEIATKKVAAPKQKWLDFAKTTLARRHIRMALEKEAKSHAPAPKHKKS